ncbi:hypothetical protein [Luteolibacter marinus]|uniref:hypothetical protein n=1 Tax=Luteolibacter marinus TaxID=2776705 RepID=UPI001868D3A9|nr:hypothetical protein [Luteolibacter marinus]
MARRVPIPVVLLLGAAAIGVPWWQGTKDMDFMTPPSDLRLELVRYQASAKLPKQASLFSAESKAKQAKAFQSPIKAPPVIHPGDIHAPAEIDAYREHAGEGAAALIELAVHLEEQSANPRALLAWERVLDSCQADESQQAAALAGIKRLRPLVAAWNIDPAAGIPLILEVSLSKGTPAEGLDELLAGCAGILTKKSSGLLTLTSRIEKLETKAATPPLLSLQILDDGPSATSTGLIELPLATDPERTRRELLAAAYKLVASQLAAATDFTPPAPLDAGDDPAAALGFSITRLCWKEFGKSLRAADRP